MMSRYHQKVLSVILFAWCGIASFNAPARAEDAGAYEAAVEEAETSPEQVTKAINHASAEVGYRFVTPHASTAAAEPYSLLKSGVAGGFSAATLGPILKLSGDAFVLNEDDYHANLFFDYGGYFRLHLESEALWHNLLTEQLPSSPGQFTTSQSDQRATYGTRTIISQMENRIKLGNNPFHLNLGYWELRRDGIEQLRFSDHYFPNSATNTIVSTGNEINRVTREGSIGFDAHLGYFDIAYGFKIRDFSNEAPDYRYQFAVNTGAGLPLSPGLQAVNVVSDSRVSSHTIKLSTDLSGGLVGTAIYSLTQRENSVDHGDARPSSKPTNTLHLASGDLTYTPFKLLSFALKYRHLQIDREAPSTVSYPYSQIPAGAPGVYTANQGILLVRPPIDTVRDTLSLSTTIRPSSKITYRLEYRAIVESRNNIPNSDAVPGDPAALHGEHMLTHIGTTNVSWKPYAGTRLNMAYTYRSTDNPEWPDAASDSHKGEIFMTYAKNGTWGTTASLIMLYENSERSASTVTPSTTYRLPRESRNNSANASLWFSPLKNLVITASYSFLQNDTDQSLLFANLSPGFLIAANYRSTAHVYGVDAAYALTDLIDISLAFQQVRSESRFSVPPDISFATGGVTYSTAGITDLTRVETTETGVKARADWRFSKHAGCSLDYSFRNYDSGNPIFDGSVHTTLLSLTTRW